MSIALIKLCPHLMLRGRPILEERSLVIMCINHIMHFYRQHFPESTVLPKMHMLESHLPDRIEKWGAGLGFMGEQGAESIHKEQNEIESSYRTIPNRVDRLLCVIRERHVGVDPEQQQLAPEIKRRKTQPVPV